jgi:hypothetical protein
MTSEWREIKPKRHHIAAFTLFLSPCLRIMFRFGLFSEIRLESSRNGLSS